MSDAEDFDFEVITSVRQLDDPPPLQSEVVTIPEWKTKSKKAARFHMFELTSLDHSKFIESGWTKKDGQRVSYDHEGEKFRFLAFCMRDPHNHRLWPKIEDAKAMLGKLGHARLDALVTVANKLNFSGVAEVEGNSEEIQSDS